jgi:hypothetical protein
MKKPAGLQLISLPRNTAVNLKEGEAGHAKSLDAIDGRNSENR